MPAIDALLLGDDVFPWHDVHERAPEIDAALGDGVDVVVATDRQRLLDLEAFDVFLDYTSDSTLAEDEWAALRSFVESGGGYLGIHCAADLTSTHDGSGGIAPREEPVPELRALLGGHFLRHPEQSTFGVEIVRDHPVTDDVSDFEVSDEPYRVAVDADAVTVLARMVHPDETMDGTPIAWVREHGDGRVCYSSLGHTTASFETGPHRQLLRNGVRWVAHDAS